jgi:hypothetical protein
MARLSRILLVDLQHPIGLRYEAALGEATLDRNSSYSIYKAVEQELAYHLGTKDEQGVLKSQNLIPDFGAVRQVL